MNRSTTLGLALTAVLTAVPVTVAAAPPSAVTPEATTTQAATAREELADLAVAEDRERAKFEWRMARLEHLLDLADSEGLIERADKALRLMQRERARFDRRLHDFDDRRFVLRETAGRE